MYFSLSDILCSQERLPCRTPTEAPPLPGLGFLDPAQQFTAEEDLLPLAPDTKLELPLWMAAALTRRARLTPQALEVTLPDLYSYEKRSGQLRADPTVLELPKCGPAHFFATGKHLLRFATAQDLIRGDVKPEEELGPVLVEMLTKRFRYILDCSFNADESDAPAKMTKLDFWERQLYEEGQLSQKQLKQWFRRATDLITSADMVTRHRKRKSHVLN